MRTDVKVGLICAFAIVLGVVIYFVSQGGSSKAPPKSPIASSGPAILRSSDSTASGSGTTTAPDTLLGSAGGGSVSGPVIGPPGAGSTATAPSVSSVTTPSMAGTATAPAIAIGPATMPELITGPGVGPSIEIPRGFGAGGMGGLGTGTTPTPVIGTASTYKIQKGDMLGTIAHKFSVSVKAIEEANPGIDSTRLKVDTTIRIPAGSPAAATRPALASTRPSGPVAPRGVGGTTPVIAATGAIHAGSTYKVKKGDTLASIARAAYGSSGNSGWQKIFHANRAEINDPDIVPVGTELKIP